MAPIVDPPAMTAAIYALVICNHGPTTPGGGRGIAVAVK